MAAEQQDLAALRKSTEYQATKAKLIDPNWRIDNLYWIQDQHGSEVLFVRNDAQRDFSANQHLRNIIVKARQLGFSTLIDLQMLDDCLFRRDTKGGIIDAKLGDAEKKMEKIQYAYARLPGEIREGVRLLKANTEEIQFSNGSQITIGTSHRGGTVQRMHISEYGKISIEKPNVAREIKTGGIPAVHAPYGQISVESTAHGKSGEFYEMAERAKNLQLEGRPLTPIDFKLHFYPWWLQKEYRLPQNLVIISQELIEYFRDLDTRYRIKIDGQQAAWYAKMRADMGVDDMMSEYPSTLDEAFAANVQGAFFKREMTKARIERRVGGMIPHDPSYAVDTWWDIGEDSTVIGFAQTDGLRVRVIDYWEGEGENIQSAAVILQERAMDRGFVYGTHYGPHDLENRDWGDNSRTRRAQALALGIKFKVIPRVQFKDDAIAAQRRLLAVTWICQERAARFVDALDNYRKKWNAAISQFTSEPLHDWASHPNDAFQQYAMGLEPDRVTEGRSRAPQRRGSAMSA